MLRSRLARIMLVLSAAAAACAVAGCVDAGKPAAVKAKAEKLEPLDEMRMPWSRAAGGYLRDWLVCGVFPNPPQPAGERVGRLTGHAVGAGHDTDYLKEMGGEAAVRPSVADQVARPDGSTAQWRAYDCDADAVDFCAVFSDQKVEQVVAYAFTTIRREQAEEAFLSLGSDDSVKVYLNGKLVHDHAVGRGVHKDEDVVPVTLQQGDNAIVLKVENGRGGWGFVIRVLTASQVAALEVGEIRPRIDPPPAGEPHVLVVATDAGLGKAAGGGPVRVEVVGAGGAAAATADVQRGQSVRFDSQAWRDGPYEVRVSRRTADGCPVFRHLIWYKGDWARQVRELLDEADKLPQRPEKAGDLRLRLLQQLVLDRLRGDIRRGVKEGGPPEVPPGGWTRIHGVLMEHLELRAGKAGEHRPHGFVRLAWRDEIDDSPQFARLYLPPEYDPGRKWPLVVVLHGYNPRNPEYIHWWGVTSRHNAIAERHGAVVLEPHGRGNTSYRGIGDADVVRAIRLAAEGLSIDADRVYLTGYSMGGGGTWHVGTRHPELFAAIAPIYGGWDYRGWIEADEFAKLTPLEKFGRERWSSFAQAESLLTTPVFVNHGDADDLVDVKFSRYAVRMLQRWGYNTRYWEHPGKGHGGLGCEDEMMRWMLRHRLDRAPRQVRVRSGDLQAASAHWVRVLQSEGPLAFIHVDARVGDGNTIRLDTENVLEVRLRPPAALIDPAGPVRVIWNGDGAGLHRLSGDGGITLRAAGYQPGKLCKTPELAGGMRDVTATPFAVVVGTTSKDPAMKRFCQRQADRWCRHWRTWQRVEPRRLVDTEVTDEQMRSFSLILIGGPEDNAVTRKLIDRVPLAIEPGAVTIDGQSFECKDAAVGMVYPHPLNPERYVSILAATSATGMFLADRMDDDWDFVIHDGLEIPDTPGEKLRVVSGYFGHGWRYREGFAVRGDAAVRAKAFRRNAPRHLTAVVKTRQLMLSDLLEAEASGSFAWMSRDRNWQGKPIRLGGRKYASGIGVEVWHEPCKVTYDLAGGGWERLKAAVGIEIDKPEKLEDRQKKGTRVFFVVRGDGRQLYRSPTFHWDSPPAEMDVDVAGVKLLELEVGNEATWHCAASSVNWADVRLTR